MAKALDTRDASDVARDLALDGSFGWLFDELGVDMEAEAVPSNRDGRRTDGGALVARQSDSSWNHRPRPVLAPAPLPLRADLADAEARARDAAGDHDGRPYSESGWVPPRRPRVLDQSVVSVKHEGWEQKRYGPGGLRVDPAAEELPVPGPRDNGTPGAASDRPAWCGWTRSRACRSRSAAARASAVGPAGRYCRQRSTSASGRLTGR